jgi:hypothetical protein
MPAAAWRLTGLACRGLDSLDYTYLYAYMQLTTYKLYPYALYKSH